MRYATTNKKYMPDQVYDMYQDYAISIMRSSPYWEKANLKNKFNFVLGGWAARLKYNKKSEYSLLSDYLTVTSYNGGWDEKQGHHSNQSSGLFNILSHLNRVTIPRANKYIKLLHELQLN